MNVKYVLHPTSIILYFPLLFFHREREIHMFHECKSNKAKKESINFNISCGTLVSSFQASSIVITFYFDELSYLHFPLSPQTSISGKKRNWKFLLLNLKRSETVPTASEVTNLLLTMMITIRERKILLTGWCEGKRNWVLCWVT